MAVTFRNGRDLIDRTLKKNKGVQAELVPQKVENKQAKVDDTDLLGNSDYTKTKATKIFQKSHHNHSLKGSKCSRRMIPSRSCLTHLENFRLIFIY